jgi:DNA integrity scanning protein DisA with diadenylate cyclase activity
LIKSDLILSAGNVLPLSKALAGEKNLGMRHRAAIGLTEQTDALVLVISEETGNVSFAYEGKLQPINAIDPIIEQTI